MSFVLSPFKFDDQVKMMGHVAYALDKKGIIHLREVINKRNFLSMKWAHALQQVNDAPFLVSHFFHTRNFARRSNNLVVNSIVINRV